MSDERKRSRSPNQSELIANTENTGSSRPAADDRTAEEDVMIRSYTGNIGSSRPDSDDQTNTRRVVHSRTTQVMNHNRNLGVPVVEMSGHQHGVIQSQRNVLGQGEGRNRGHGQDQVTNRRVLHSRTTHVMDHDRNMGIPVVQMSGNRRNVSGQGEGRSRGQGSNRTRPVLRSVTMMTISYRNSGIPVVPMGGNEHGVIQSHRNALGQGPGQRQGQGQHQGQGIPVLPMGRHDRYLGRPVVGMSHLPLFVTPVHPYSQVFIPSQHFGNINMVPSATSGYFMPRSIHEHNIRFWSDPNRVGVHVYRQQTTMIQIGTPMPAFTQMLPFPNMNIGFPVVGPSVNLAFLVSRNHNHANNMGTRPNANVEVGSAGEHNREMIGEASNTAQDTSSTSSDDDSDDTRDQDSEEDMEHKHEHGSRSGDG